MSDINLLRHVRYLKFHELDSSLKKRAKFVYKKTAMNPEWLYGVIDGSIICRYKMYTYPDKIFNN